MLLSVFLALCLPFAGGSPVLLVYVCLLKYVSSADCRARTDKLAKGKGLSTQELAELQQSPGRSRLRGQSVRSALRRLPERSWPPWVPSGVRRCVARPAFVCPVCMAKLEPQSWAEEAGDHQSPC